MSLTRISVAVLAAMTLTVPLSSQARDKSAFEEDQATLRAKQSESDKAQAQIDALQKKKQVVPYPEVNRINETLQRQFTKEVAELTGQTLKAVDEKIAKAMRNKLLADN